MGTHKVNPFSGILLNDIFSLLIPKHILPSLPELKYLYHCPHCTEPDRLSGTPETLIVFVVKDFHLVLAVSLKQISISMFLRILCFPKILHDTNGHGTSVLVIYFKHNMLEIYICSHAN